MCHASFSLPEHARCTGRFAGAAFTLISGTIVYLGFIDDDMDEGYILALSSSAFFSMVLAYRVFIERGEWTSDASVASSKINLGIQAVFLLLGVVGYMAM